MTIENFKDSLSQEIPPAAIDPLLLALWLDAKDDWTASHEVAQKIDTQEGSWVHGYLHRKEGDLSNAKYWYHLAGRKFPEASLNQEWEELVRHLLNKS